MTCATARACAAIALAAAGALICTDARADDWSDLGFFGFDAFGTSWAKPPSMLIQGSDAPPRIAGLGSPQGTLTTEGAGVDFSLRLGAFLYEGLRLRYSQAWGQPLRGLQTADEAPYHVTQGPLQVFELGSAIPLGASGVGGQIVGRHTKLKLFTDWGVAWAWADATVRDPAGALSHSKLTTQTVYWRTDVSGCVRVGASWPHQAQSWACVTAGANLYEFDWLSGWSLGVRVDL
jgi:hypothetical protein